jgi:hypothetical protein
MSRFSQTIGSITLAGLTFLAGCRKAAEPDRAVRAQGKGVPPDPAGLKVTPLVGDTNQLAALQVPSLDFGALGQKPTAIRSTNSPQYKALKPHLDVVEKWITAEVDGGARVLSKATRRSPENDNAVRSLKFILNDFNSLIKDLYASQKPWRPLNTQTSFNDGGATEAMVGRTEELLGLPRTKRYGRTVHFALTEALREAYGLEPRLHTVLKRSVLKDNESLLGSPNSDPYSRYPALKRFCSEPTRRIIEAPSANAQGQQRDVAAVIEMQHCLIKMGYSSDFPKLRQTGIRDNATDEALKRFEKEFIRSGKPMLPDQSLVHQLVSISTGFDFLFGATLNHEYRSVPFSMDPMKTYCGMTWPTLRGWCDKRGMARPNNMFEINRAILATCYREEFILASGTQHLLYYSGGPLRTNALMLAHVHADAAFNRNPGLALDMREKALGIPDKPTRESMEQMLRMNPAAAIERLVFERARVIGFNDRYEDGLINRLKNMAPYLPAIKPERLEQVVDAGFKAGQQQRAAEPRKAAPEKDRPAEKKQKKVITGVIKDQSPATSKRTQHTPDKTTRRRAG